MPYLEFEGQPPIPVNGHSIDNREPESVIKLSNWIAALCQLKHKATNVLGLGFPLCLCRLELLYLGLGNFVPLYQTVVAFQVGSLILDSGGILLDTPLGQLGYHLHFGKYCRHLSI